MYVPLDQLVDQFAMIRKNALSHTTVKLIMFVSCLDVDALCAAKMLTQLFKSDLIPHQTIPVAGFEELAKGYEKISEDSEITTVLLIGCGATIDLLDFLGIDPNDESLDRTFYILDNNRPWNLENLFSTKKVICFYDEDTDETSYTERIKSAYIGLLKIYEDQNQEAENSEDDLDVGNKEQGSDDDDVEEHGSRRRTHAERKKKQRLREADLEKYEERIMGYYNRGSYVSIAMSTMVYQLLSDLGVTSVNSLWLTTVGSTSLDARHPHIYKILFPALKSEVLRLGTRGTSERGSVPPSNGWSISSVSQTGDDDSLYPESDYLFFLLRHWSLFESMMHSSYISAKLKLYTNDGRRKLKKMLAKMGISLHDAREQWLHTNVTVKKTLNEKIKDVASIYGIEDVTRDGIIRRFGFKGSVSAGDCVDALVTILQIGHLIQNSNGKLSSASLIESQNETGNIGNGESEDEATRERFWVGNFWNAWDAMDKVDKLLEGINRAKQLQQMVVVAATQLFEKRQIKNLKSYRLAVIQDGPDLEFFANPLALIRLALWLSDACAESTDEPLPFVVASLYPPSNSYLVLGMGPRKLREQDDEEQKKEKKKKRKKSKEERKRKKRRLSDEEDEHDDDSSKNKSKSSQSESESDLDDDDEDDSDSDEEPEPDAYLQFNTFSSRFNKVADIVKAAVKVDAFDSSIIEVARDDLPRFLEELSVEEGKKRKRH